MSDFEEKVGALGGHVWPNGEVEADGVLICPHCGALDEEPHHCHPARHAGEISGWCSACEQSYVVRWESITTYTTRKKESYEEGGEA